MDCISYIREKTAGFEPEIAIALGSGLGNFADEKIDVKFKFSYSQLEGFPEATVNSHKGNLVFGEVAGVKVVCMQGRNHYYEGYSMKEITFPVRVMRGLGARTFIVTNAAGGINEAFEPGNFMVIADHINFLGTNPLIGGQVDEKLRFPDMTHVYDRELSRTALTVGMAQGLTMHEGVYLATTGPSFETPAEIRAFRVFGADAVGMSTVPEVIVARQEGMRILGVSFISNKAAGLSGQQLTEEEVFENANRIRGPFMDFVEAIVTKAG